MLPNKTQKYMYNVVLNRVPEKFHSSGRLSPLFKIIYQVENIKHISKYAITNWSPLSPTFIYKSSIWNTHYIEIYYFGSTQCWSIYTTCGLNYKYDITWQHSSEFNISIFSIPLIMKMMSIIYTNQFYRKNDKNCQFSFDKLIKWKMMD